MHQLHDNPISSPTKDKIRNTAPRKSNEFYLGEFVHENELTYVKWKNETVGQVSVSLAIVQKLLLIVKTPNCTVSPFKVAWRKQQKKFGASDVIIPAIKFLGYVNNHGDGIRLENNEVMSRYSMKILSKLSKMRETEAVAAQISDLVIMQECDHEKNEGVCITKMRKTKMKVAELAAYKTTYCAHGEDLRGVCQMKGHVGFQHDAIMDAIDRKETVTMTFVCNCNCVHEKGLRLDRLQGEKKMEVMRSKFLTAKGKPNDAKPRTV